MRLLLYHRLIGLGMLAGALLCLPAGADAQTVVEVQGGGSSLNGGYGATANFWRSSVDGWIGLGYLDGFRAGVFLRKAVNKDTLRFGNDALVMRLPTDVFTPGFNLLVQGVSFSGGNDATSYLAFGGASSSGLGAPSFQASSIEEPDGRPLPATPGRAHGAGQRQTPSSPTGRRFCRDWSGSPLPTSPPPSWRVWAPAGRTGPPVCPSGGAHWDEGVVRLEPATASAVPRSLRRTRPRSIARI